MGLPCTDKVLVSVAAGERSLGIYKTYYWLTVCLFVLMFVMAAWFVCLVAVNTTGAHLKPITFALFHQSPSLSTPTLSADCPILVF